HNGKTVIADQVIPGLSGSSLDADESAPGPLMLQGEETTIEFRDITISVPRGAGSGQASLPSSSSLGCGAGDSTTAIAAVRERLAGGGRQNNGGQRGGAGE